MNILFTGGSSFTGAWFVRSLAEAGHKVFATFRQSADAYPDQVRRERVQHAKSHSTPMIGVSFGDDAFLTRVRAGGLDVLAHHAADVTNYRSPDFDVVGALANNTRNLRAVLEAFKAGGGRRVVLTGTVFEGGEGAGSQGLPHFSPYGLSKALTAQLFQYECDRADLSLGKFVIPNPFGPFEEPRYTAYLMKNWFAGATPSCNSPSYVRDNIHASLLAKAYAKFVTDLPESPGFRKLNPSGYVETQGAFTIRLAGAMSTRLDRDCMVELKIQTDFSEPRVRINTDLVDAASLGWDESKAWDEMAEYYQRLHNVRS
jgi:UDP-glucose 4-epimerase